MADSFEAHITFHREFYNQIKEILPIFDDTGWTLSAIADDPVLGPGIKAYLTAHDTDAHNLFDRMCNIVAKMTYHKVEYIRLKIERIVYDTATETTTIPDMPLIAVAKTK